MEKILSMNEDSYYYYINNNDIYLKDGSNRFVNCINNNIKSYNENKTKEKGKEVIRDILNIYNILTSPLYIKDNNPNENLILAVKNTSVFIKNIKKYK